ncbi:MAG: hypothetical protein KGI54_13710 [Pseudomonadota bacterium]|nr:hypothetical protein [Pseudomonadota bacterium]
MERIPDSATHDLRRHESKMDALDRFNALVDERTKDLMMKGEKFDPFTYGNISEACSESVTAMEEIAALLNAGLDCAAGALLKKTVVSYVEPMAGDYALDTVGDML